MKKILLLPLLAICLMQVSCKSPRAATAALNDDGSFHLTIVQINDVYEIAPLEGGNTGGMARVATLKKQYLRSNPNTLLLMAGDFVSPSIYNSLKFEGRRIRGQQMIESMNAAGTDIAVFGNHEFDITESELQSRLNESTFQWVASNSFHKSGDAVFPFVKKTDTITQALPQTLIKTFRDADGTEARIGFIGLTQAFNKASYVSYTDPFTTAETLYNRLKDSCDAVIAITHQQISDDSILARRLPNLALIVGGHEHDMRFKKVGGVLITKAHSNARSAYVIDLQLIKKEHAVSVTPTLKFLDQSVAYDPATDSIVKKWTAIADKSYASLGFNAGKVLLTSGAPLEAREVLIRKAPTNFSKLIVAAIKQAVPAADVALLNAGSIRVDDVLQPPVTQYDILRSLPFGGGIAEADMKGRLLIEILEAGRTNIGTGGFLHYPESVRYNETAKRWLVNEQAIDTATVYKVALPEFLMTGGEANMGFLTKDNPGVVKFYPAVTTVADARSDIRLAIIRYMEKTTR